MRLFIAIPLPPDVRRQLAKAQQRLMQLFSGGRYVPEENFHITLHFIGESDDIAGAAYACGEAARGIRPFVLRLAEYGSFARAAARTGYIGLAGELPELYRLHETLTAALRSQGFSCPQKRLTPHITLARELIHTQEQTPDLSDILTGPGSAFTADQLVLYESRSANGRMLYTPLHRVRF